jgi:hypothetical protein
VGSEAVGELADPFDRLLDPLGDDVGGAELLRQRGPLGVAAEDDDLIGTEALGGDHAAESDCAVADDGHLLPGPTPATTAAW